jgi:antitoxin FitA
MTSLTIKNIPKTLYQNLKRRALNNRRSLNSEILVCLEEVLQSQPYDAQAALAHIRDLRQTTTNQFLTDEILQQAKSTGRL